MPDEVVNDHSVCWQMIRNLILIPCGRSYLLHVIVAVFLVSGCNPGNEPAEKNDEVRLTGRDGQLLEGTPSGLTRQTEYQDSLYIESIPAIAVQNDGSLFIAAERYQTRKVYYYSPEGELLDSLGAYGSEPGEFQSILNMQLRDHRLYLFDDQLGRVTQFNLGEWSYEQHFDLSPPIPDSSDTNTESFVFIPVQLWGESSFLGKFDDNRNPAFQPDRMIQYYLITEEEELNKEPLFELRDTNYLIGDHAGRPAPFLLPYSEKSLVTRLRNGSIYTAWTEDFIIDERNLQGKVVKSYTYPFNRAELDLQKLIDEEYSHNRQLKLTKESAEYPEKWPALFTMFLDDEGRLWIAAIPGMESHFEWWVVDTTHDEKVLLSVFRWPRESVFIEALNGMVYAVERNDAGFKKIVRYRIDFL